MQKFLRKALEHLSHTNTHMHLKATQKLNPELANVISC